MNTVTWIGDSDPEAQVISHGGLTFVRGEKTEVKDKDVFERLSKNPMFSADGKFEAPAVNEPSDEEQAARAEEGTVKAALKRELAARGVAMKGNPSEDTLRNKLAEVSKA